VNNTSQARENHANSRQAGEGISRSSQPPAGSITATIAVVWVVRVSKVVWIIRITLG
jgi:hypothetical protein